VRIGWRRSPSVVPDDIRPLLKLRLRLGDNPEQLVVPDAITFRTTSLRIGAHPPFMDTYVGHRDFSRLPFLDIRGDDEAVRDLSRHVACLWRDASSGDCFVQLGWPGPGEPIRPRAHARVLRQGRPQDAVTQPFRLMHRDVLRLSPAVEYVFLEVGPLRNRVTPERNKMGVLEMSTVSSSAASKLGPID
jgi:hypothetical protein